MIRNKKILTGIDHTQYEHPFDKKALSWLLSIVGSFHSWTVMQAAELMMWKVEEEYNTIIK